jgi:hypothetical protein
MDTDKRTKIETIAVVLLGGVQVWVVRVSDIDKHKIELIRELGDELLKTSFKESGMGIAGVYGIYDNPEGSIRPKKHLLRVFCMPGVNLVNAMPKMKLNMETVTEGTIEFDSDLFKSQSDMELIAQQTKDYNEAKAQQSSSQLPKAITQSKPKRQKTTK